MPKAFQGALDGVQEINNIIGALEAYCDSDSEQLRPMDVGRLLFNSISVAKPYWCHVANIVTDFQCKAPFVDCLQGALSHVFLTLIRNSCDAIAEIRQQRNGGLGTITISTLKVDDSVQIVIADNGCGISREVQERIFEPFFTTKAEEKGTGLGLAACHAIIAEKLNGNISFESTQGEGTRFLISLPCSNVSDNVVQVA
jgi:signal transduction histidine kinase